MSDFCQLSETFFVSPQITEEEVAEARRRGIKMIVNNRPEFESEDQTSGEAIEAAAREAGIEYRAIPITHSGFSEAQIDALIEAIAATTGPVLAYCRSGTRSAFLWALAQARQGEDVATVTEQARSAGYDLLPISALLDMLSKRASA